MEADPITLRPNSKTKTKAVDMDTRFEGNGEVVVVVLAIVIDQKRFSDLKLLLIVNVFIINQVIKSIMHIVNDILLGIFFVIIFFVALRPLRMVPNDSPCQKTWGLTPKPCL